ncbi:MAG: component of SufBCD complex [Paracoccaceae bacterium]
MDWYAGVIEIIDLRSFSSIWYWIVVAVLWSTTAHWTLGVPFDVVAHARRQGGGQAQADLESLVRANCNRILYIMDVSGPWVVGFVFFALAFLAALGFAYRVEMAQAIFLIAGPMALVFLISVQSARQIRERGTYGEALRRHLARHRFLNQVIGLVSIFITAFWGMWYSLGATVL